MPSSTELLQLWADLREDDLSQGRRGGWSVREILHHVIGGERHYTNGVAFIRGGPPGIAPDDQEALRSGDDAARMLVQSRLALLTAVECIDENDFYRLTFLTNEEGHGQTYSVLSILENVALHDREHTGQIQAILTAQPGG